MRALLTWGLGVGIVLVGASGRTADLPAVPCLVQAESPDVEHTGGGLGNRPGWWSFWSNGDLGVRFRVVDAGLYRAVVRACGTDARNPATGETLPKMVVSVEGLADAKWTWDVAEKWGSGGVYTTPAFRLEPGEHTIRVAFTNDYGTGGADRNLFVDWVAVGPVSKPDDRPALTRAEAVTSADPQPASPTWRFGGGDALGWRVVEAAWPDARPDGAHRILGGPDGLYVTLGGPDALVCSPRIAVDAGKNPYVSIVMTAGAGTTGEVRWASDRDYAHGAKRFPLIADGKPHVYTLALAGGAWTGTITVLSLQPSDAGTGEVVIHAVYIANRPMGPAEPRVEFLGLDDAIVRSGLDAKLVCAIRNGGGESLAVTGADLALPPGVAVVDKPTTFPTVRPGARGRIVWTVRSERPFSGEVTVTVHRSGREDVTATAAIRFTPRVATAAHAEDGKLWPPVPEPVQSDYLVGAYYFPGWRSGTHAGWAAIAPFPDRKPVLGWYEEGEPGVAEWHIKWAAEHGISFFAYDWYWDRGSRSIEHALNAYLQSPYRSKLKFCLLWANHNPPGSTSEEDLLAVTRFWIDHYFHQPEYQTVDGKPVVIIFAPGRIAEDLGPAKVPGVFEKMRALCRAEGLPGLYLAACVWPSSGAMRDLAAQGYDAGTGYNYPDAGARPEDGNRPPYSLAIEGYHAAWERAAAAKALDYIPITDPGWDSRPWAGDDSLVRTGKHPDQFRRMLELARGFADAHPVGPSKTRMVLVEAWNEFGEGAAIEPAREFGFGWLDAIRDVFTSAPRAHEDVIPADVGLTVPQWESGPPRTDWEFDVDGNGQGWGPMMGLADFRVAGGAMEARVVSTDPAFACSLSTGGEPLLAADWARIVIRMRLDQGTQAQLFWATADAPESEANSIHFPTVPDGEFHDYVLDLSAAPTWAGEITHLRFDPNDNCVGSVVAIDSIRLERK